MLQSLRVAGLGFAALLLVLSPLRADEAAAPQGKTAYLELRLPADARVELNGSPTQSTGESRRYESPALRGGKTYYYVLKATWMGRSAEREVVVRPGETTAVVLRPDDFRAGTAPPRAAGLPARDGFVAEQKDGQWWIFRSGSKELAAYRKDGPPEKHVTRLNVPPLKVTLKAPDAQTLDEYLVAKPGFVALYEDGRLWVFRTGSKELAEYKKNGELAKHVTRIKAGPGGVTIKGPDAATLDDYLKAPDK